MIESYPLVFKPAYKHYLWGGRRIPVYFNRNLPENIYAESWEVSDRDEGMSFIQNGPLKNYSFKAALKQHPALFLSQREQKFPLLAKLIDASDSLSIQVHPNDETAEQFMGEPKSEMWYIIDADPGSCIYLGLKSGLTTDELRAAISENRLEEHMNKIPVSSGECYYIPGGLIHSIGKGCLIYEVQQNSNTTYRLYDWARVGPDGNSRPLHIEKGLAVMLKNQSPPLLQEQAKKLQFGSSWCSELVSTPYFTFSKWTVKDQKSLEPLPLNRVYFVLKGDLTLKYKRGEQRVEHGQSFLIPPNCSDIEYISSGSDVELLETKTQIC